MRVPSDDGLPPLFPATLDLLARLRDDPRVEGVILGGSVALGVCGPRSDDDLEIVLSPPVHAALCPLERTRAMVAPIGDRRGVVWDAVLTTLDDLGERARSPRDAEHWPYEHSRVVFARSHAVADRIARLRAMPPAYRGARVRHALLDLLLAAERAQRCPRPAERALLSTRGARALARLLFALEGRWVPLDHWLEHGLGTLADPARNADLVIEALATGEPGPLTAGLARLSRQLAERGLPTPQQRDQLAAVLLHPARRPERIVHGLC